MGVKGFFRRHKVWLSQFSSAFTGTVLGIAITLGITLYQDRAYKEETTRKFIITTIKDLEDTNDSARSTTEDLMKTDSLFTEVLDYYPEELDSMPIGLINQFATDLGSYNYSGSHKFSVNLFLNNPEIMHIFDDLSVVNVINTMIETTKALETFIDEAKSCKSTIYEVYCEQQNYRRIKTGEEFVKILLANDIVINKMDRFSELCMFIPQFVEINEQLIGDVKEKLGLTPEDFEELTMDVGSYHYSTKD